MTNKEIFKKCMDIVNERFPDNDAGVTVLPSFLSNNALYESVTNGTYYRVIFSHEFAKLFWGEEKDITNCVDNCVKISSCYSCSIAPKSWEFHLQQMVLEKEPLKYLKRFL